MGKDSNQVKRLKVIFITSSVVLKMTGYIKQLFLSLVRKKKNSL